MTPEPRANDRTTADARVLALVDWALADHQLIKLLEQCVAERNHRAASRFVLPGITAEGGTR